MRVCKSDSKKAKEHQDYLNEIKQAVGQHIDTYIKNKIGGLANE